MKTQWLILTLGIALSGLLFLDHTVFGGQTTDTTSHPMRITGPVAAIRPMGRRIAIELGGQWRRRFAAVIDETDVLVPLSEINRRYQGQIIQVDGPVYENRGRFEIQIQDLSQITVVDPNAATAQSPATVIPTPWPGDFASLAREIKKLRREVAHLKSQLATQQRALQKLQTAKTKQVEVRDHRGNYRELEYRVHRIEALLDQALQVNR